MQGIITRDGLFDVQKRALEESEGKPGFCFFMEQGLGKTRTVAQEFYELAGRDLADVLVVVCPRSLRGNWRDEMVECGYPFPIILLNDEKKDLKVIKELGARPYVLVFHYELVLTRGRAIVEELLKQGRKVYMALDESVRIKNFKSKNGDRLYLLATGQNRLEIRNGRKVRYQVVKADHPPIAYKRVLSGTPAPQGPHDLWNQFRFIGAMERTPYFAFRTLYCKMGGFDRKKIVGAKNLDVLRMRTGDMAFRAKKVDWTDLPEKLWAHPREIDLTERQRRAYLEILHEFAMEIGPDEYITVEMAITVKNKLQQICSGWVYDNEKEVREIVPVSDNPKLQDLREFIEGIDSKVLVFYFFKPTREYLEQLAESMGIGYTFLESGLKDAEFDARKARFNTEDECQIAFCQTDAVKEGHTLLGTKNRPCHTTYFLENTYSLYARKQAEDRNHRHGQYNAVTYHDVSSSREDKAIIKALQKKDDLMEALLGEFTAYREGKLDVKA